MRTSKRPARPLLRAAAVLGAGLLVQAPAAGAQPACPFNAPLAAYLSDPAFAGGCIIGGRIHVSNFGSVTTNYDPSTVRIETAFLGQFAVVNVDATADPLTVTSAAPGFRELTVTFRAVPLPGGTITGFSPAISGSNYQVGAPTGWSNTVGVEAVQEPTQNRATNTRFAFNGFQPFPTGAEYCTINSVQVPCNPTVTLAAPVTAFDASVRLGAYVSQLTPNAPPSAESMASIGYGGFTLLVEFTAVPEPQTIALLGAGLGALAAFHRRRARRGG